MSLLAHDERLQLIASGVIEKADPACVNSTRLDTHLGEYVLTELPAAGGPESILYINKKSYLPTYKVRLRDDGMYVLAPGDFLLAQSKEVFMQLVALTTMTSKLKE